MAIDTSVPRTRRALLAGGIGGLAALVASALGRPLPASAADGQAVLVGGEYNADSVTAFTTTSDVDAALAGTHNGIIGIGIYGVSKNGTGVYGTSHAGSCGVYGRSAWGPGVAGDSDENDGVAGTSSHTSGTGVHGQALALTGRALGVIGESYSTGGVGVFGATWGASTGVMGASGANPHPLPKTGVYGYAAQDSGSIGVQGTSTAGTGIRGTSGTGDGVVGFSGGTAKSGVYGYSTVADGFGVFGRNKGTGATGALAGGVVGVRGTSPAASGVVGSSGSAVPPVSGETGVHGYAIGTAAARGVHGQSTIGRGVFGEATTGTGVYASATTGYALRAVGRVRLDKCAGVTTIAATKSSVTVTPGIDLVATSAVVASLMGSAGGTTTVHRSVVNVTTNTFTIYLTKATTQNVKVAWHVFG